MSSWPEMVDVGRITPASPGCTALHRVIDVVFPVLRRGQGRLLTAPAKLACRTASRDRSRLAVAALAA